ncbi:hypothetical protein Ppa06_00500 [Planomonospora parontospora subsp. parontospora]|uniref:Uncharacterized protein n=2 Tax=Planomonospora parontospora TaxID=58119 RepID=A0AA37F237_9ACTN|nr:hypothetical protein GCM10010126_00500 [Planomonospora parontospora]GII06252.1 hypothetical protein Ppa06_00500 [Planomonospora parontospora subsp. parontospora]
MAPFLGTQANATSIRSDAGSPQSSGTRIRPSHRCVAAAHGWAGGLVGVTVEVDGAGEAGEAEGTASSPVSRATAVAVIRNIRGACPGTQR